MTTTFLQFLAQAAPPGQPGLGQLLVPFACVGVIFYFGVVRPQQKKQRDMQTLVSSLKTGDKVVTSGGIHGIVANVKDGSTLSLKIADNVRIEVDKTAIASVDRSGSSAAGQNSSSALPAKASA